MISFYCSSTYCKLKTQGKERKKKNLQFNADQADRSASDIYIIFPGDLEVVEITQLQLWERFMLELLSAFNSD